MAFMLTDISQVTEMTERQCNGNEAGIACSMYYRYVCLRSYDTYPHQNGRDRDASAFYQRQLYELSDPSI